METKNQLLVKKDKEMKCQLFKMKINKKALSGVVTMVVMIALVMAIMAVVITTTKKTINKKINQAESCGINTLDKLSINSEYVCYDSSEKEFVFSINREDLKLDKLIISVETETSSEPFEMRNGITENFEGKIVSYPSRSEEVSLPLKNSGKTYIITDMPEQVTGIKIAPVINGENCEIADSLNEIIDCSLTTIK